MFEERVKMKKDKNILTFTANFNNTDNYNFHKSFCSHCLTLKFRREASEEGQEVSGEKH